MSVCVGEVGLFLEETNKHKHNKIMKNNIDVSSVLRRLVKLADFLTRKTTGAASIKQILEQTDMKLINWMDLDGIKKRHRSS